MECVRSALRRLNLAACDTACQLRMQTACDSDAQTVELRLCSSHPRGVVVQLELAPPGSAGRDVLLHVYGNTPTFTSRHWGVSASLLPAALAEALQVVLGIRDEPTATELDWEMEDFLSDGTGCLAGARHITSPDADVMQGYTPADLWCIQVDPYLRPPVLRGDCVSLQYRME
jgi:hypothetical protein